MDEEEAVVGGEGEEGIGEGVVTAIKVVMEIIKVDMGITSRVGMGIIKIMVDIQTEDEVVGEVGVGGIVVLVMMVAGVEVQVMKVAEVGVMIMKEAEAVVTKVAEVVVTKEEEVVVMKEEEVVMKVAEVVMEAEVVMKEAEVVVMKEAEVEEGVMGVVGAEWVDVIGVVATRHDSKGWMLLLSFLLNACLDSAVNVLRILC